MKTKKIVEDKYTQPIFCPNDLYVYKNCKEQYIIDHYLWDNGDEIEPSTTDFKGVKYGLAYRKDDPDKKLCMVVLLDTESFEDEYDAVDIIAHESTHVTNHMLSFCSIPLSRDTDEVFAFLNGWVAKCVYTTYKKKDEYE